jgi:unsaturated chondroitin disaccharide hydrolase
MNRVTTNSEFLMTARRCADFWLERVPPGQVPLWDLDVPDDGNQPYDSSAAAIAASGLWDLSFCVDEEAARQRYRSAALQALAMLCTDDFLARGAPGWEGILMHGVYHKNKSLGVDESVAWGEYFFVEALVKALKGDALAPWV